MSKKNLQINKKIFLIILILAMIQTLVCVITTLGFIINSDKIQAVVSEIPKYKEEFIKPNKGNIVVSFTSKAGKRYKYTLPAKRIKDKYSVGDSVSILFNTQNQEVKINSFYNVWRRGIHSMLITLLTAYFYYVRNKEKRKGLSKIHKIITIMKFKNKKLKLDHSYNSPNEEYEEGNFSDTSENIYNDNVIPFSKAKRIRRINKFKRINRKADKFITGRNTKSNENQIYKMYRKIIVGTCFILMVGIFILIPFGKEIVQTIQLNYSGEETTGKVIEIIKVVNHGSRGSTTISYRPLVEFKTQDGEKVQFESNYKCKQLEYSSGDKVKVIYAINNPRKAQISSLSLVIREIISFIVGLIIFVVLPLYIMYFRYRKKYNFSKKGKKNPYHHR